MAAKPKVQDPLFDPDAAVALIFASQLGFAIGSVVTARGWARALAEDRGPSGLGFVLPRTGPLVAALLAGAGLAGAAIWFHTHVLAPPKDLVDAGLGGLLQLGLTFTIVVLAPPSEELVFRSLLLQGLAASWGKATAAVVTTVLFVAMHVFQILAYWPALIFLGLMSVASLVARFKSGSLFPSIAVHATYNLVLWGASTLS